jgi:hypothetical protein
MKKLILLAAISLAFSASSAQNISLINPIEQVFGFANSTLMEAAFNVKNESSSSIEVFVIREEISIIQGSDNNICWGPTCYPPFIDISATAFIPAEGINESFKGDYYPNNNVGTSIIKYCFVNNSNHEDSVCVTISYIAESVGVLEKNQASVHLMAFPNPSADQVTFSFGENIFGNIQIMNFSGSEIYNAVINGVDKLVLSKGTIPAGIYFCKLRSGEKQFEVKKLVIKD